MTIEQFLGLSAEEMHSISDEELLKHFGPLLKITRPLENKDYEEPTKEKKPRKTKESKEAKIQKIIESIPESNEESDDAAEDSQMMLDFFNE